MSSAEPLTCREFIAFLDDYIDERLVAARRAVFEAHLAECPPCRAYLDEYRETVRLVRAAGGSNEERPDPKRAPRGVIDAVKRALG